MKDQIEKQAIEEMAKVIKSSLEGLGSGNFNFTADEISVMFAKALYNAGYRKQGEWISVDARLPSEEERRDEYGELVPFLVCEKDTKYPFRAFYDGTIWGDGLMKIKGITHWMPLPEPPKMKGGAE